MNKISQELQTELENLAKREEKSLEELLSDYIDLMELSRQSQSTDKNNVGQQQPHPEDNYYRGLLESQIDFICRYTPDTILTYVNDAYCQFFDHSREELLGSSFLPLTGEVEHTGIFERIRQLIEDPAPDDRIFPIYNSDGRKRWIQWVDYGITNDSGKVVAIQAVGRDVTELFETQQHLQDREEMLSTLFKHIPVLLAQFDETGQFQYVNQHWVDVLGWTVAEMIQHPNIMEAFYPDPDYRQEALEYMLQADSGWREFETRTKDGRVIRTAWANVRLSDGRTIGIGVDLSERIQIEERLRISEEKYRQLVETAHDLIWSVDVDGKITYINSASEDIYGFPPEEMIGRYYQDFVPEDQLVLNNASWQAAIDNGDRLNNFENWVMNQNGERILLNTNVFLKRDDSGNITGSMGTAQNITHRQELENQRVHNAKLESELEKERQLREIKDRFVSVISHEFRTPLAVISSSTSLITLYFDRLSRDKILDKLMVVQNQIVQMVELMEATLRISKSQAGKTEFAPKPVEAMHFFASIIDTFKIMDEGQHPIMLAGDRGQITIDPKLFEHVISNLLSNAIKYSPAGTPVTIKLSNETDHWQVRVEDHGMGIPESDLDTLFEPFQRASNAHDISGTGLGLSIAKEYVEIHGGEIRVESDLGAGSTFIIILPS